MSHNNGNGQYTNGIDHALSYEKIEAMGRDVHAIKTSLEGALLSLTVSVTQLSNEIKGLSDKIEVTASMWEKAVPVKLVMVLFAIMIGSLFGVKSLLLLFPGASH